jgi:hypothetical protein
MDPARRLGRPGYIGDPVRNRLHQLHVGRREPARIPGQSHVRENAPAGVPVGPRVGLLVRQRQAGNDAGPGRAEVRGSGRVEPGQAGTESLGRLLAGRALGDPLDDQDRLAGRQHLGHRHGPGLG